ncbi:unnamed protein product [Rotaria sp. Silwood2]|nr:unnamed protein product [Rotaria sp. Silwood2]
MHLSRTKIFVDFMKNYTNERVYIEIPDNTWPIDEPISQEITIPNKPKIPSPFDRSKLKEQIKNKQTCSQLDLLKMPKECDQLLNLQTIIHQKDEEIHCGDLFGTSQTSHLSAILQINNIKFQQKNLFDDDDELLEAFNKYIQLPSSNQIINPSSVLVLTNRVNTQIQTVDITLPKFDLEFSFDDLDNSDEQNNNFLQTQSYFFSSISESTSKNDVTTYSDKFERPIRPIPSKKHVRRLSTITPDIIERKKYKSAHELGFKQQERHFHRCLALDFLNREAIVDKTLSDIISSDEDENEHNHFIDD